jgi:hypothetical protein
VLHDKLRDLMTGRIHRRTFLGRSTTGIGALALASLLDPGLLKGAERDRSSERWKSVVQPLHFAPKEEVESFHHGLSNRRGALTNQARLP